VYDRSCKCVEWLGNERHSPTFCTTAIITIPTSLRCIWYSPLTFLFLSLSTSGSAFPFHVYPLTPRKEKFVGVLLEFQEAVRACAMHRSSISGIFPIYIVLCVLRGCRPLLIFLLFHSVYKRDPMYRSCPSVCLSSSPKYIANLILLLFAAKFAASDFTSKCAPSEPRTCSPYISASSRPITINFSDSESSS